MMNNNAMIDQIMSIVNEDEQLSIVQPVKIGETSFKNELLLFIKPEIFMVSDYSFIKESIKLILGKFDEFKITTDGVMMLMGKVLAENEIMNNHYGYINKLSKYASKILSNEDRQRIYTELSISNSPKYLILGGHEFLTKFSGETPETLAHLWFTKNCIKLRSGFYVQMYEKYGEEILLVNGFHPAQLSHFTDQNHKILLFLLHSDTDWGSLKNEMVGATFPEKAVSDSIRGIFYRNPEKFGLKSVSIGNNGVHLSAGPFEAMFEIVNFLGSVTNLRIMETPPLLLKKLIDMGISFNEAISVLENPIVRLNDRNIDLFSATEDTNTDQAINLWMNKRVKND